MVFATIVGFSAFVLVNAASKGITPSGNFSSCGQAGHIHSTLRAFPNIHRMVFATSHNDGTPNLLSRTLPCRPNYLMGRIFGNQLRPRDLRYVGIETWRKDYKAQVAPSQSVEPYAPLCPQGVARNGKVHQSSFHTLTGKDSLAPDLGT
ncbi:hypothetical protein FNV43_RR00208 [Rhamnella rubrinervis]|uniref:Uncharacterized protein n=1 Tax=Rhamnella rubrinervis TaxID=2594499 RepID=A0A8K0HN91_9ROSA|nr:hypothetical protein FNV43_RR00208 [Rhamnella rubrinervis]